MPPAPRFTGGSCGHRMAIQAARAGDHLAGFLEQRYRACALVRDAGEIIDRPERHFVFRRCRVRFQQRHAGERSSRESQYNQAGRQQGFHGRVS
jgi:hypothetical protein